MSSTGRTSCREQPPPPRPRLSSDTVNQESDEGSSDIQMASSIVAVAFGKKGEHPGAPDSQIEAAGRAYIGPLDVSSPPPVGRYFLAGGHVVRVVVPY